MTDFQSLPDLAARPLGGSVVAASDEFFAEKENLIKPESPVFSPQTFNHRGQVYDGWETRRRRVDGKAAGGSDWAVIRLGVPGVIHGVVVDTAFFKGNYPPECSVEGLAVDGYPSSEELAEADWIPVLPPSPLQGDSVAAFGVEPSQRFTHVRLSIYPDGGVARLRVHGEPVPDPRDLVGLPCDLAALENGGAVTECSNAFFAAAYHLLYPGLAATAGEGWESARRREGGNDWVTVRLAGAGTLRVVEVDTSHFRGNAPDQISLYGGHAPSGEPESWRELLPATRVQPDTRHRFRLSAGAPVTHLRLEIHPDGGVARLRAYGELTDEGTKAVTARWERLRGRIDIG